MLELLDKTDLLEEVELHPALDFGRAQVKVAAAAQEQQQQEVLLVLRDQEDCLLERLAGLRLLVLELVAMATQATLALVAVLVEE